MSIYSLTSVRNPSPTATTVASRTLPWDFSGRRTPPFVFTSAANRSTRTLSKSGRNRLIAPAYFQIHKTSKRLICIPFTSEKQGKQTFPHATQKLENYELAFTLFYKNSRIECSNFLK